MDQTNVLSIEELAFLNSLISVLTCKELVSLEEAEKVTKLIKEKVGSTQHDEAA